jgi:hypothetical protein
VLSKREFIKTAAAAAAAAFVGRSLAAERKPQAASRLDAAIFDARYGDSRDFAMELEHQGAKVLSTGGDSGALWYRDMQPLLARGRIRFAGMTPGCDLFILGTLAAERGMRVLYRAEHDCRRCRPLTHTVQTRADARALAAALQRSSAQWPALLARTIGAGAAGYDTLGYKPLPSVIIQTATVRRADHPGLLVSWVIG